MASDRYGSARLAEAKDLKAEGILTIPAAKVASGEGGAEVNRAFLLGCEADAAAMTKGMRDGYNEMLGAISGGTTRLVRKMAGEHYGRAFLGWAGDGHVLTVAPTRSGKGVGLVIPNLLHYPGTVIVIDPKGENYAVTVTGLSSDGYRHQVIEDYTHEQMAGNTAVESQGADYWDSSSKDVSASNDSKNAVQSENADYWDNANNSSSNEQSNENENSLSNEASC